MNLAELEQDQLLQDVEEGSSGDDEGDAASVDSAGSQREAPHSQYTVEQKLESADAAELEKAAADAADFIFRMNRNDDATMLFSLEEGRRDAGEVGVDSWANPADSVVAESLHPSDLASVVARTEITLLTEGAVAAMPDHSGPQATESSRSALGRRKVS